jgi:UDP-N-acetyl-D-galactosamine dehydrogenase
MLIKFFTNETNNGYLNGLAVEFGESTNAIRLELNNLSAAGYLVRWKMKNKIMYAANRKHPLFELLQKIIRHHLGLEQIVSSVISQMGAVEEIHLIGDYANGRINPGDKERTVTKILKVTSGSTPEAAKVIDKLYQSVICAGTHLAPSIRVAEAAKVIENSQRDINIAFVNELAKIFNLLDIDTAAVLKAAGTKWNFLPFTPGLVGGHCIGVDPYYLAQKAQEVGYHPEIILAGRRLNDSMGQHVSGEILKLLVKHDIKIKDAKVLILGISFKENCPDVRNTKVVDVILNLQGYGMNLTIFDPWVNPVEVQEVYQLKTVQKRPADTFDAIVLAVAHNEFINLNLKPLLKTKSVVYDVKGILGDKANAKL